MSNINKEGIMVGVTWGTDSDDVIIGTSGRDIIQARHGADTIYGNKR